MPTDTVHNLQAETDNSSKSNSKGDWFNSSQFAVAVLVIILLSVFWKTVFLGAPISKIGLLGEADALLNPSMKSVERFCLYDPSIYELAIPIQIVIERMWHSGSLPLWNPYNGCGYPMIGDIQSFVFSPVRFLFSASRMQLYNLSLVLQVVFGALCMFALSRKLFISRISAVLAALSFALCPYLLRNLELPSHNYLFPGVFLAFVWLAYNPTVARSILTGLACGIVVMTMHPECALFSIGFASLLFVLFVISNKTNDDDRPVKQRALSAFTSLTIAGLVALCFAAPVIFPFCEYMANSECYKTADFQSDYYSVNCFALLLNFFNPAFGNLSPYIGIVAMAMVPIALFWQTRITRCLGLTTLTAFLLVTCLGPVSTALHTTAFSWLVPVYALPVLILGLSLIAGCGLDQLLSGTARQIQKKSLTLIAVVVALGLMPPGLVMLKSYIFHGLLKNGYVPGIGAHLDIDIPILWINALILAGVLAVILALRPEHSKKKLALAAILLVGLNCASQAKPASLALPIMPGVMFKALEPIPFLQNQKARTISTGVHLFLANTNAVFGIPDLRLSDALFPERYLNFINAAGAKKHGLFLYCYHNPLSKLLDLASIKYILTQYPLMGKGERRPDVEELDVSPARPVYFTKGLRLEGASFVYVPGESAAFCRLKMKVHKFAALRFTLQPVLLDDTGNEVWSGDKRNLHANAKDRHIQTIDLAYPVPTALPAHSRVKPGLRIFGARNLITGEAEEYVLHPAFSHLDLAGSDVVLKSITVKSGENIANPPAARNETANTSKPSEGPARFRLVKETPELLRVYENTTALPEAYIVHSSKFASSADEALKEIQSKKFNPYTEVILEQMTVGAFNDYAVTAPSTATDTVIVRRPNNNNVEVSVSSQQPGYLVLTDTFYPGWKAYIDGKETPVLRANYLFRAIAIPAGEHKIHFTYVPTPFWTGALVFLVMILTVAGYFIANFLFIRQKPFSNHMDSHEFIKEHHSD